MKSFRPILIATMAAVSLGAAAQPKSADEKKIYELPTTGKNLERQNGGWINVEATGAQLIVKFFDMEEKPIAPDVERATARFRYAAKSSITRTVLNRAGDTLVSPANVRPPHNFLVTLTLLRGDEASDAPSDAVEIFNFKYP